MSRWDIITRDRRSDWESTVAEFDHDIYHRWEYHQLAFENGEGDPVLIKWGKGKQSAAIPLLVRTIPNSGGLLDATSVYGYPGPLCHRDAGRGSGEQLGSALEELGIVSAFSRLNPFLQSSHALGGIGSTARLGPTVSLDLSIDAEKRWAGYARSARRRILNLERLGAEAFEDTEFVHLEDFARMYQRSMERVGAEPRHAFSVEHSRRLIALVEGSVTLIVCRLGHDILAAGLYFSEGEVVHAHLGADNPDARKLAPQRLELHAAAGIFAEKGSRRLNLGGGVGSANDGLLAFKRGFSHDETPFSIWRHVVDEDAYRNLCAKQSPTVDQSSHFPAYRSPTLALATQTGSR